MSFGGPEKTASLVRRQMGNDVRPGHELVPDVIEGMGFHHRCHHRPGHGQRDEDARALDYGAQC